MKARSNTTCIYIVNVRSNDVCVMCSYQVWLVLSYVCLFCPHLFPVICLLATRCLHCFFLSMQHLHKCLLSVSYPSLPQYIQYTPMFPRMVTSDGLLHAASVSHIYLANHMAMTYELLY